MSKNSHGGHFGGAWGPFVRFEGGGDQHFVAGIPHAIESLCKIRKKLLDSFWEIKLLSEKLTDDDDGQLGIRKDPLLAELKSLFNVQLGHKCTLAVFCTLDMAVSYDLVSATFARNLLYIINWHSVPLVFAIACTCRNEWVGGKSENGPPWTFQACTSSTALTLTSTTCTGKCSLSCLGQICSHDVFRPLRVYFSIMISPKHDSKTNPRSHIDVI